LGCSAPKGGQIGQIPYIAQGHADITQKAAPFDSLDRRVSKKQPELIIAQTETIAERPSHG
jgi:hypothetical protein